VEVVVNEQDNWVWRGDKSAVYSEAFNLLVGAQQREELPNFDKFWHKCILLKV